MGRDRNCGEEGRYYIKEILGLKGVETEVGGVAENGNRVRM